MKRLNTYINETLKRSQSEHINETLKRSQSEHINEWKASTNTVSSIKKIPYFIYKLNERRQIKIFDNDWVHFKEYKNNVYINGKNIEIKDNGFTEKEFKPDTYCVEIKDIDNVTNCQYMFFNCVDLINVPLFDTSKVEYMYRMFSHCVNLKDVPLFDTHNAKEMCGMFAACYVLEDVPLFDTHNVENMSKMFWECKNLKNVPKFNTKNVKIMNDMFWYCDNLNEQTKQEWSQIYDFEKNNKK